MITNQLRYQLCQAGMVTVFCIKGFRAFFKLFFHFLRFFNSFGRGKQEFVCSFAFLCYRSLLNRFREA